MELKIFDDGAGFDPVTAPRGMGIENMMARARDLGGSLSLGNTDAGFGKKVRGLKATADELPDYVERVVRNFDAARQPDETFAQWVQRAEDAELS